MQKALTSIALFSAPVVRSPAATPSSSIIVASACAKAPFWFCSQLAKDDDGQGPNPPHDEPLSHEQDTGGFANPNHLININGDSRFDYTHQVKLDGTYRVPLFGGFNISGVYRYTTGLAWGRLATIRGLTQGSESVRIEPLGTRRTDAANYLDFRAEKTIPLGSSARQIGIYLDIFNVNNQGIPDNGDRRSVIESSGTTFGNPNRWISPRLARLGFRLMF